MEIIYDIEALKAGGIVATMGFFDGVHNGHRFLIEQVKSEALKTGIKSMLITFDQHPRMVLNFDFQPHLLNTYEEKMKLLGETGVDYCCVLPFTLELSKYSSHEFLEKILHEKLHVKTFIVGHDHRFGHNREDNFKSYEKYGQKLGMKIIQTAPYTEDDIVVSSSVVRRLLEEGNVEEANRFLSYRYFLSGVVIHGREIGRSIHYPTANLKVDPAKEIPMSGVYAVLVDIQGKQYKGMLNIGTRPTIDPEENNRTIEVNIFDFDRDIYDETLKITFVKRIRDEQKFDTVNMLAAQIDADKEQAVQMLQGIGL